MIQKTWIAFLARGYFQSRRRNRGLAASFLSILGIAVGTATLISVLGVMNGFQTGFINSILEISSNHVRIQMPDDQALDEDLVHGISQWPEVTAIIEFSDSQTLIKGPYSQSQGALVRGVPQDLLERDPGLAAQISITEGRFDLSRPDSIILGSELARSLGVWAGDQVSLLALAGEGFSLLRPRDLDFQVAGIFRSGYYDIDLGWAFVPGESAREFLVPGVGRTYGVKIRNHFQDQALMARLARVLPSEARISSWREYNQAFFSALRIEKLVMMTLIGLIFLMVGVNIYHSLRRSVRERREDIGLLKALGAGPRDLRVVFLFEGVMIGLMGGLLGVLGGLYIGNNINTIMALLENSLNGILSLVYGLFPGAFPGSAEPRIALYSGGYFYLTSIPSVNFFHEILLVFVFALGASSVAAWVASGKITGLKPAEILRSE